MGQWIENRLKNSFVWFPEYGTGFYPVQNAGVYDEGYFRKYQGYEETEAGVQINEARLNIVSSFLPADAQVVDFGIGSGAFIKARKNTVGYDINPFGVGWLKQHGLFYDLSWESAVMQNACFWDSLEHVKDPWGMLQRVLGYAFVTVPIFENADHVLRSKHFRKDEHYWYWTRLGFRAFAEECGFVCVYQTTMEQDFGREDVMTFVLLRKQKGPTPCGEERF